MIVSELQSPDGDVKIVRSLCCQIAGYIMIYLPPGLLPQIFGKLNLRRRIRKLVNPRSRYTYTDSDDA